MTQQTNTGQLVAKLTMEVRRLKDIIDVQARLINHLTEAWQSERAEVASLENVLWSAEYQPANGTQEAY